MKKLNKGFTLIELLVVIAIIAILATVVLTTKKASACGWFTDCSTPAISDTKKVQNNQKALSVAVPLPTLSNSLERANISKRLTTFDDPVKVSYIYLTSYGHIMAFYTVKGKVTSGGKRLTAQSVTVDGDGNVAGVNQNVYNSTGSYNVEQPELDGTYGSSSPYIFFWTTDGTYVQWNGEYMLSDNPLQLNETPVMVRSVK